MNLRKMELIKIGLKNLKKKTDKKWKAFAENDETINYNI